MIAYFAPKKDIPRRAYVSVSTVVALSIFGFWCVLSYGGLVRADFLPTPDAVLRAGVAGLKDGSLLQDTAVSVTEIMSGFVIASVISVPLGILMGSYRVVEAAVEPVTNFVRYLPVSAMIPLLILWVGIDMSEKIAVIFIGTFFQQLIMVADVSRSRPAGPARRLVHARDDAAQRGVARAYPGDAARRHGHVARHAGLGLDLFGGGGAGRGR